MKYKVKSKLAIMYNYLGMDNVEYIRIIVAKVVFLFDKVKHFKDFSFLKNIKYDKLSYRNFTSGPLGASLYHSKHIIKKHMKIKDKTILIIGCGKGEEIHSWIKEKPKKIIAIEYLDYSEDWKKIKYTNVAIIQKDIKKFKSKEKFDIVTSKAVMEHVNNLENCFSDIANFSKKGGLFWADFGPLYYTYKGCHLPLDYDHLLLPKKEFNKKAIKTKCETGLILWRNNLFSKLKYEDYMKLFNKQFKKQFLGVELSEYAIKYKKTHKNTFKLLLKKYKEDDLMIKSIFYLGKKK